MRNLLPAAALLLLAGCGPARGSAALRLAHPDPAERLLAVSELDRAPDPSAREALLTAALEDPDPGVRQAAGIVLEDQTRRPLEELAVARLKARPDPGAAEWLLRDSRQAMRASAVDALASMDSPRAWTSLAGRLREEPSPGIRVLLARRLSEAASRGAGGAQRAVLEALRAALSDPEAAVRSTSALALAREGDPQAAPVLAALLPAAEGEERARILEALRTATGRDLGEDPGAWSRAYPRSNPSHPR